MRIKVRPDEATLLYETRDSVHRTPLRAVQGVASVPTMSDYESWEHTASCSQDVCEGEGLGAKLHHLDWPLSEYVLPYVAKTFTARL